MNLLSDMKCLMTVHVTLILTDFFFQAEDGIRDTSVTGVQTCALPISAMEELHLLPKASTPAPVLVVQFSADRLGDYQRIARNLRAAGVATEVFPEAKKIGPQLQYARSEERRVGKEGRCARWAGN